ncbi:uncharacterized protein LOC107828101 [Nicotiana tabacum]|uniref:Uncharacterized protein LOC107828101 n=1 Tax=Nicotiana tabacum TaxID=4097 RepID=A0AC58S5W7_TOBAC
MDVCDFFGYPKVAKCGLFYCPSEKKVTISVKAKFLEEGYLMNHVPISELVLQKLSKGMVTQSSEKLNDQVQTLKVEVDIPLHFSSGKMSIDLMSRKNKCPKSYFTIDVVRSRSEKEVRMLVRYRLLGESYNRIPEEPNNELVNYDQVLQDKDVEKWAVKKSEIWFMYSNQVWDLVEPPDGVEPIGCK